MSVLRMTLSVAILSLLLCAFTVDNVLAKASEGDQIEFQLSEAGNSTSNSSSASNSTSSSDSKLLPVIPISDDSASNVTMGILTRPGETIAPTMVDPAAQTNSSNKTSSTSSSSLSSTTSSSNSSSSSSSSPPSSSSSNSTTNSTQSTSTTTNGAPAKEGAGSVGSVTDAPAGSVLPPPPSQSTGRAPGPIVKANITSKTRPRTLDDDMDDLNGDQAIAALKVIMDAQKSRLEALEQSAFPAWARDKTACPDAWSFVVYNMSERRVYCKPPDVGTDPGNERCRLVAKFGENYDRCSWSRHCKAAWSKYGCFPYVVGTNQPIDPPTPPKPLTPQQRIDKALRIKEQLLSKLNKNKT